jgi:signal transduction histidine kinase
MKSEMEKDTIVNKKFFRSLYWRISATFLVLLALIGLSYVCTTTRLSNIYFQQINQRLNRNTAGDIVSHSTSFRNGKIDETGMAELFHNIMAINPSLEVYLLAPDGAILSYYAPVKKIVSNRVNLSPVREFVKRNGITFIKGDDPRHPGIQKVFSAAPILNQGVLAGYIYVVLAGEEYDNTINHLRSNYMLQIGTRAMLITLLFAFTIGLVIFWLITKNLGQIVEVMKKFKQGDLGARIKIQSKGDVKEISRMFNEMADILTQNIRKLKEVEVLRRELVANISHDLRTPISIIQGYVETLFMKGDTLSPAESGRYLNTIYESVQKLEKLVNELFELSKLEANQVQPVREPFFISELVSDISNRYQLMAKDKHIILDTMLSKEQRRVFADVGLIERVIQNLIDNALKFTPSGGRVIVQTSQAENGIKVSVSDSGIGIQDEEKDLVFGRYYKGHNFKKYKNSTGLGLAIAKKILDLHEATLTLNSRMNEGTSFAFELPLHG